MWAPGFSRDGALIFYGGGHGGSLDVALFIFDFSTGLWSRVGPAMPTSPLSFADLDPIWADHQVQGQPVVLGVHTYNYPTYVPPGVSGVGPRGGWLLPQHAHIHTGGFSGGALPHAVDLATGTWMRFSRGPGVTGPFNLGGTIDDTRRGRVWWSTLGASVWNRMDWSDEHPRPVRTSSVKPAGAVYASGSYYPRHVYVPEADMVVGFWCEYAQTAVRGEVLNCSTGEPVRVGTADWPVMNVMGAGFGVDWCPATRKFYLYEGYGRTRVLTLQPSSLDFSSCSWTWGEEPFSKPAWAARNIGGGEVPLSRWRYIPTLGCFAWCDGPAFSDTCADGQRHKGVMQLWRPQGT